MSFALTTPLLLHPDATWEDSSVHIAGNAATCMHSKFCTYKLDKLGRTTNHFHCIIGDCTHTTDRPARAELHFINHVHKIKKGILLQLHGCEVVRTCRQAQATPSSR